MQSQEDIKLILNEENQGFPKGCNQGIQIANKENDILLLNNDTIVTKNWLKNLKICLESSPKIGAVGPVCNNHENRQGVDFTYDDFDIMQKKAEENNISDSQKWEPRNCLIGFCLLIKRDVINELNGLDEEYTPGYIEDNDLSLLMIQLGYQLMLCHDVFIHHYLGTCFRKDLTKFYPILEKNRKYFEQKWHFTTFATDEIKSASFPFLEDGKQVLELNCGVGSTILSLKYQWKNISIEGVEEDPAKRKIASNFTKVYSSLDEVPKKDYDYILIGNILETVEEKEKFLEEMKKYLKEGGSMIGEFHNFANIKNIRCLLQDSPFFIDINKKNRFTLSSMKQILENQKYKNIQFFGWYISFDEKEKNLFQQLEKYNKNLRFSYYGFKARI